MDKIFKQAQVVAQKLANMVQKRGSASGDAELDKYLSGESSKQLVRNLLDEKRINDFYSEVSKVSLEESKAKLGRRLMAVDNRRHRRMLFYPWAAAACIVFAFMLFNNSENKIEHINTEIIAASYSVPTIVRQDNSQMQLADGGSVDVNCLSGSNADVKHSHKEVEYSKLVVPVSQTFTIQLSDGSEVKLNSNSKLDFPTSFEGDIREVYLSGEAYFKIEKGEKPFIVHTKQADFKVYGTEFNINLNKSDVTEAVLVSGSISATLKNSNHIQEIFLKENQLMSICVNGQTYIQDVDCDKYLGWLNNKIYYEQESLGNVLNGISAWYGAEFIVNMNDTEGIRMSVNISNTTKLETLIGLLSDMFNLKFVKEDDNVYYVKRK